MRENVNNYTTRQDFAIVFYGQYVEAITEEQVLCRDSTACQGCIQLRQNETVY